MGGKVVEHPGVDDVVDYLVTVRREGGTMRDAALPITDRFTGAQVLLVPVVNNDSLASLGLTTRTVNGTEYYELNRPGTYEGIWFSAQTTTSSSRSSGDFYADTITVTALGSGEGLETQIQWYIDTADYPTSGTIQIPYSVVVDPDSTSADTLATGGYELDNIAFLGDHQGQRLYDETGVIASQDGADKHIVTDMGAAADPSDDTLAKSSPLTEGATITYRLTIEHSGSGVTTVDNTTFYDALPKHVAGTPWTITDIRFVPQTGTTVTGANSWSVSDNPPTGEADNDDTQSYIVWGNNFSLTTDKDAYVYVTMTAPTGADWAAYEAEYRSQTLLNTVYVNEHTATVLHSLGGEGEAILQKGVNSTGYIRSVTSNSTPNYAYYPDTTAKGRYYYSNSQSGRKTTWNSSVGPNPVNGNFPIDSDSSSGGNGLAYVTYYVTLYNSGEEKLYINEMQDVLPEGFYFFEGDATSTGSQRNSAKPRTWEWTSATNASTAAAKIDDPDVVYKKAGIHAALIDGDMSRVVFTIDNDAVDASGNRSEGNLNVETQDPDRFGKYYLDPGEAVVFSYVAVTGSYSDTEDIATNKIAMPYDNFNGKGVNVSDDVDITSRNNNSSNPKNDGTSDVSVGLPGEGFDGGTSTTEWLTSDVSVYRETPIPNITKTATATTSDPSYANFASRSDTVDWTVTVTNPTNTPITQYVISDVIMAPFRPTGAIKLTASFDPLMSKPNSTRTMLTITGWERNADGSEVAIISGRNTINGSFSNVRYTVGSGPKLMCDSSRRPFIFNMTKDASGNLHLDITPYGEWIENNYDNWTSGEGLSVPANGSLTMTVSTAGVPIDTSSLSGEAKEAADKASAAEWEFTTIYNDTYITPLQPFNESGVSEGENTEYTTTTGNQFFRFLWNEEDGSRYENGNISNGNPATVNSGARVTYTDADSVKNTAQVPVGTSALSGSYKGVEEIRDDEQVNATDSLSGTSFITLDSQESTVRYSLVVNNIMADNIDNLVIIDNLPQLNDHYSFDAYARDSQFKVDFAANPNLRLEFLFPDETEWTDSEYLDLARYEALRNSLTIQFSDKTEFTSGDKDGSASDGWGDQASSSRSIRMIIRDVAGQADLIPGGTKVRLSFDAKISDGQDINDGMIAWNTFGYNAHLVGQTHDLQAVPPKVGIRAPEGFRLTKQVVDENGDPFILDKEETFKFILVEGNPNIGGLTSTKEILRKVDADGLRFAIVSVPVPAGVTSATVDLSNITIYAYNEAVTYENTDNPWVWIGGSTYTLIEAPDSAYEVVSLESSSTTVETNKLTFTYASGAGVSLTAVNEKPAWQLDFIKVDGGTKRNATQSEQDATGHQILYTTPLSGAIFGIYSPKETDQMSAEEYAALRTTATSLTSPTLTYNGTTYYLMSTRTTGANGQFSWTDLTEGSYIVREIVAPANYDPESGKLLENNAVTERPLVDATEGSKTVKVMYFTVDDDTASDTFTSGKAERVVLNEQGYELPHTGGSGVVGIYALGLALVGSAFVLAVRKRKGHALV